MKLLRGSIVVISIIVISLLLFISNNVYASNSLSLEWQKNLDKYSIGDEIKLKIKLNQKVMTASYYLNYNSSAVSYKKTDDQTSNLAVKDYPEDNILRVVYADMSGVGTDEITVTFVLNKESDEIAFFLTNATFVTSTDKKPYADSQINGIENKANIQIKDNTSSEPITQPSSSPEDNGQNNTGNNSSKYIDNNKTSGSDTTVSNEKLPQTGNRSYIILILVIGFVGIAIYFGCYSTKLERYLK